MVRLINSEDKKTADAVEAVLPQIAAAIDIIYKHMEGGGRLIYCGCGTSGRLGLLDAAECPPTFGVSPDLVVGLIAGGDGAFTNAVEGAEDDFDGGKHDLAALGFTADDVLVGIAASGRTPYVLGAMEYAKSVGAEVIGLCCSAGSPVDAAADVGIAPMPGAEVITGSTRLKSGTVQKMTLNMLSTGVMIKLGKVYSNLMVDVKATNQKLSARAVSIVRAATDADEETARRALEDCGYSAKAAILMLLREIDAAAAAEYLKRAKGRISAALELK